MVIYDHHYWCSNSLKCEHKQCVWNYENTRTHLEISSCIEKIEYYGTVHEFILIMKKEIGEQ